MNAPVSRLVVILLERESRNADGLVQAADVPKL